MIRYIIYVDILGFENLPQEISEKTGLYADRIRQDYFSKPFKEAITKIEKKCIQTFKGISEIEGSDSCILVVDTFQATCKILSMLTSIEIPHKDYGYIPFEIALDVREFEDVSDIELINKDEIIKFLKNDILSQYRKYYRAKHRESIRNTFVVATEQFINQLEPLDRTYYEKISYVRKKFFIADLKKILERSQVYKFLEEINIEGSKLYERINDLYIPPLEYEEIKKALEKENIVFITGAAEYGKTYTAVRLLWEYFIKGYIAKWIPGGETEERVKARKILEDIEKELKPNHILYFEDPFGKIRYEKKEDMERKIGEIVENVQSKREAYVVITSREEVFKEFEKENLSAIKLRNFEMKMNIKKPSYNYKKRKNILITWAKVKGCLWIKNTYKKNLVLSYIKNKKYLPTPLSMRQFVIATSNMTEPKELLKKIKEKSKETAAAFAKEVESLSNDKILFLSFPLISSRFKINFFKKVFNELVNDLNIETSGFEEILEWFKEDKIDIRRGEIKFVHPSYEEAKRLLLFKKGKHTKFNKEIYSNVLKKLLEKGKEAKNKVVFDIIRNLDILSGEFYDLLTNLIKNDETKWLVGIAVISWYRSVPDKAKEILNIITKNKRIAGGLVWFIQENLKELPEEAKELQSRILKRDEVCEETASFIIEKISQASEESKELLNEMLEREHVAQHSSMYFIENLDRLDKDLRDSFIHSLKKENVALFLALYLIKNFSDLTKEKRKFLFRILRRKKIMGKVAGILLTNIELFPKEVEVKILDRLLGRSKVITYLLVDLITSFEKLPKKSKNALIKQIETKTLPNYMLLEISKKLKRDLPKKIELSPNKIKKQIKEGYKHLLKVQKVKREQETKDPKVLASLD